MSFESNLKMLELAHDLLGNMVEEVVFVGGTTTCLYMDQEIAENIRPTLDVDCVIEVVNRIGYDQFQERLRAIGFTHDTSKGAPICRFRYGELLVLDVMPNDESILGFSNPWYKEGISSKIIRSINNKNIYIFPLPLFLASKFEAFLGRGKNDPRFSWDLEDIVLVIDGIKNFNLTYPSGEVRDFLADMVKICKTPIVAEAISGFLGNNPQKIKKLNERLNTIAKKNTHGL